MSRPSAALAAGKKTATIKFASRNVNRAERAKVWDFPDKDLSEINFIIAASNIFNFPVVHGQFYHPSKYIGAIDRGANNGYDLSAADRSQRSLGV